MDKLTTVKVRLSDFERCNADLDRLEDENEKLKESLAEAEHSESMAWDRTRKAEADNAELRYLIFDMLVDEERGNTEENTFYEHVRLAKELGIEAG